MEDIQYVIYIYFIVGLACFIFSAFLYKKSISTKAWPSCKGEILHSSVKKWSYSDKSPSYKAKINYKYIVDNQIYISNRIYYGSFLYKFSAYRKEADLLVKNFKVGNIVDVFFDPQQPNKSVLKQGVPSIVCITLAYSCLATLIAVLLMLYYC